ncbi:unnamed protein product [Coffea canephora]|uniref:Uncharacterized protein n=1 Tax=Coffea canephora TaxID=49390 RepID=A0A068TTJ8_COFCA|nr:unnamed protein product [Coffea canephora]
MPDMQGLVNELIDKLKKRDGLINGLSFVLVLMLIRWQKGEGITGTALQTAELLRSVISVQKLPPTNKAAALINAVRDVGEKLIAANPVELSFGNVIRRVLHIVREEDLSPSSDEAGDNEE